MSSYLPSRPHIAIPPWLQHFNALFPIITYPAAPTSAPPTIPTLWLLGPPPAGSAYSIDPECRIAESLAQFAGVEVGVKWLETAAGGVGAKLPNLHLPDGSLLSSADLAAWFLQPESRATAKGANTPAHAPETTDPTYQAFNSLLKSTLLPATLAAVYLSPSPPAVTPAKALPALSTAAASVTAKLDRRARTAEVQRLRGGKAGFLDLDELDGEAAQALDAFEAKMRERSKEGEIEGWFDGAGSVACAVPPAGFRLCGADCTLGRRSGRRGSWTQNCLRSSVCCSSYPRPRVAPRARCGPSWREAGRS